MVAPSEIATAFSETFNAPELSGTSGYDRMEALLYLIAGEPPIDDIATAVSELRNAPELSGTSSLDRIQALLQLIVG